MLSSLYQQSVGIRESGNIKAGLEHLSLAEQAKARLQLVLEAAAKADEALKAKERSEEEAKKRKEEGNVIFLYQQDEVFIKLAIIIP
nr:serine/Arginine-related protein 53-like [Pelodiscus sinensis]|eukprot:XP_025040641.1 serine/Arginine-related protein 53-like [Pelodiscus sinensis]